MAIKMQQGLKQTQNLTMTPQLQQAIKLLTLTHLEMTDLIANEMVDNPMLEETGKEMDEREIERQADQDRDTKEATSDDFKAPDVVEGDKDFDWADYVANFDTNSSTPPSSMSERSSAEDRPDYENMVSGEDGLVEHFMWQLRMENFEEEEWKLLHLIVHGLNDDGFFEGEWSETFAQVELTEARCWELVEKVRLVEPIGCATSGIEESLLVQARYLPYRTPLVEQLIQHHLKDLKNQDFQKIQDTLSVSEEAIHGAAEIISELHPRPGRLVSSAPTQYVVPDIYIKEVGGEFQVQVNDDGVPRLRISKLYKELLLNKEAAQEAQEYVQEKLRSAKWLINSIDNRQRTIVKVAEAILRNQPEFFRRGPSALKPMILKDIAAEIGVHESTVSRVTTNKFLHCPLGTFELKFFFNAGIGGKNGGIDMAAGPLKMKIKELIDAEDPKRPLSDQKISDILKVHDILVARRTVAKYREAMDILPSSKRKTRSSK